MKASIIFIDSKSKKTWPHFLPNGKEYGRIFIRTDSGALFENYVFLELIKNAPSFSVLNYYRTRNGAEVDFVLDTMTEKKSFEVKFKYLDKPGRFKSLESFNSTENIKDSYLINLNLNLLYNGIHFLPSCLISKVF